MQTIPDEAFARLEDYLFQAFCGSFDTDAERDAFADACATPGGVSAIVVADDTTTVVDVTVLMPDGPQTILRVPAELLGLSVVDGELVYSD